MSKERDKFAETVDKLSDETCDGINALVLEIGRRECSGDLPNASLAEHAAGSIKGTMSSLRGPLYSAICEGRMIRPSPMGEMSPEEQAVWDVADAVVRALYAAALESIKRACWGGKSDDELREMYSAQTCGWHEGDKVCGEPAAYVTASRDMLLCREHASMISVSNGASSVADIEEVDKS